MGYKSNHMASDTVTGTGSAIDIICGFKPKAVMLYNTSGKCSMFWNESMADGYGYKVDGAATGSAYVSISGSDIKGSANTNSENSDAASLPTNGALWKAATAVSSLAGTITPTTQPDLARNVGVFVTNDSGGALNLYEGVTTFTVTGFYKGAAQSDTITITSSSGNKSVADSKYRYKYGVKPFDTITSVTYDNAPANTLKLSIGPGSLVGLYNTLFTPAEADVVKVTKNAANLTVSSIVNTTNNTLNLGTLTDNDDFQVVMKVPVGVGSSLATTGGVTPSFNGFSLGTDADMNVNSEVIYWVAFK